MVVHIFNFDHCCLSYFVFNCNKVFMIFLHNPQILGIYWYQENTKTFQKDHKLSTKVQFYVRFVW